MIGKIKTKIYKLLRWSEKYTKTDMVYLAKGGFWLTLGQIVSFVSVFLLAVVFANLLPKETYGTYKYILSIVGILTIPTLSGINTAILQAVARGYEGSFLPAIKTKIRWGLLGALGSLILATYYYYQSDTTLAISFLISGAFLPFMDTFPIYNALLQGKKIFDTSAKYTIITQIIATISMVITVLLNQSLFLILLAYFIPWTLLRFIFLKRTIKKIKPNNLQDKDTITYGKHLSLVGLFPTVVDQLDKILLFHFLGTASLAIYAFSLAPVVQFRSFLKSLTPLSLPKFANNSKEEIKKTLPSKLIKFYFILIVVVIVYIVLIPYFFEIFFPQYMESVKYSQYFVLVLLFYPKKLLGIVLLAQSQKKAIYISSTFAPIFKVVLLLTLLPIYGIMGAITAELGAHMFNTIVLIYFFKKM